MAITYPYTAQYKEGVEYVGAWRGTVDDPTTGHTLWIPQPRTIEEQEELAEYLRGIAGTSPDIYTIQPVYTEVMNGGQGELGTWWDEFLKGLGIGYEVANPFMLPEGWETPQFPYNYPPGMDWGGLDETFTKYGILALVGLGFIAVIMVFK